MTETTHRGDVEGFTLESDVADDRLRRVVHAMLAIYLLPALVLVMAVGGIALLAERTGRGLGWLADRLVTIRPRSAPVMAAARDVKPPLAPRVEALARVSTPQAARARQPRTFPFS